jgi:hypothetical protein
MSDTTHSLDKRKVNLVLMAATEKIDTRTSELIKQQGRDNYQFEVFSKYLVDVEGQDRLEYLKKLAPKCAAIIIVANESLNEDCRQVIDQCQHVQTFVYYDSDHEAALPPWLQGASRHTAVTGIDELNRILAEIAKVRPAGIGVGSIRGCPETTRAVLSAQTYADILADVISNIPPNEPATFAVFSPWGRGKTYLSKLLQKNLPDATCVPFSAWKYHTSAEVWSFLYETLYASATRGTWLTTIRGITLRNGPWTILCVSGIITFVSFVMIQKSMGLSEILDYLTTTTIAGFSILIIVYRFIEWLINYLQKTQYLIRLPRYDANLGLQHPIGNALRILLRAWVSPADQNSSKRKGKWQPWAKVLEVISFLKEFISSSDRKETVRILFKANQTATVFFIRSLIFTVFLMAVFICVAYVAAENAFTVHESPNNDMLSWTLVSVGFVPALVILLLIISTVVSPEKKPVLLIVDDLDRVPSGLMLDVIESLLLFLDDPQIASRLRVMFLIEEESLRVAFREKYLGKAEEKQKLKGDSSRSAKADLRLHKDQLEKHFLFWLRLGPLSAKDASDVLDSVYESLPGTSASDTISEVGSNRNLEISEVQRGNRPLSSPNGELQRGGDENSVSTIPDSSRQSLTPTERDEIRILVKRMADSESSEGNVSWTPRRIRSLVYRYQLARDILKSFGAGDDLNTWVLITAIINADPSTGAKQVAESGKEDLVSRVASEVA